MSLNHSNHVSNAFVVVNTSVPVRNTWEIIFRISIMSSGLPTYKSNVSLLKLILWKISPFDCGRCTIIVYLVSCVSLFCKIFESTYVLDQ
jgi:hypothetical protein